MKAFRSSGDLLEELVPERLEELGLSLFGELTELSLAGFGRLGEEGHLVGVSLPFRGGKKGSDVSTLRPRANFPERRDAMPIDRALLDILRCPDSKAPLVMDGDRLVSTDRKTRRSYRVDDGDLPVMVIAESDVLDETAWLTIMQGHGVRPS